MYFKSATERKHTVHSNHLIADVFTVNDFIVSHFNQLGGHRRNISANSG